MLAHHDAETLVSWIVLPAGLPILFIAAWVFASAGIDWLIELIGRARAAIERRRATRRA